jgi:SAM-dependent methyltransferase
MDPYADIARYYDWEHDEFDDDIAFYLNSISGGPVLEVGVGTGRIALPLARAGYEIWGVDPSDAMLTRARERLKGSAAVHLCLGFVDQLDPNLTFPFVVLALNTLWHLPDLEGQIGMLRSIERRLRPGGLLLVDLSNPLTMADRQSRGELRQRVRRSISGRTICALSAAWDNEAEQLLTLSLTYEETHVDGLTRRSFADLRLRYLYRFECELALRQAGLALRQCYGWYDLQPFTSSSPNLLMVASSR